MEKYKQCKFIDSEEFALQTEKGINEWYTHRTSQTWWKNFKDDADWFWYDFTEILEYPVELFKDLFAVSIDLNNGGALELLNKSIKTGQGRVIDGRGLFPIVCLSNIRTNQQQNAFFLNVINNDFNSQDFNKVPDVNPDDIRRGCPTITSGADEDAVATAVSVKILTDRKVYNRLIAE